MIFQRQENIALTLTQDISIAYLKFGRISQVLDLDH